VAALGYRWDGKRARLFSRTKPGSFEEAWNKVTSREMADFCPNRGGHRPFSARPPASQPHSRTPFSFLHHAGLLFCAICNCTMRDPIESAMPEAGLDLLPITPH